LSGSAVLQVPVDGLRLRTGWLWPRVGITDHHRRQRAPYQ